MPSYAADSPEVARLNSVWQAMEQNFADYLTYRALDTGTWNLIRRAELDSDVAPELKEWAQGISYKSGQLDEDIRVHVLIRGNNATRFNALAPGANTEARKLESDWKLTWASWWDNEINQERWLDDWVYTGQVQDGLTIPRISFKKRLYEDDEGKRPVSGCPLQVEKTVLDAVRWQGDYRNPPLAMARYSVSVIDCDIKNAKGERPTYEGSGLDNLGWVSEATPEFYTDNANKMIDIIVMDAEDPIAICPLPYCDHKKRKITVAICKKDGKAEDLEEIETYDSPFKKCSFVIVGGDIRHTERNPHRIFRPSAWVQIDILVKINLYRTQMLAMLRQQLADDSKYINAGGTSGETINALGDGKEGGATQTFERPEPGTRSLPIFPGPVSSFGNPQLDGLMALIRDLEAMYDKNRPNPALVGQMVISEVSATAAQQQVQGAGVTIGGDLKNWDGGIVRMWEETQHAICFTGHFEREDEQTKYVATVSGKERVNGARYSEQGDETFIDAKKAAKPCKFLAMTSKDTPSERRDRRMQAVTGLNEGILVMDDVDEAWDIYDSPSQNIKRADAQIDTYIAPLINRLVAAYATGAASARTGVDYGSMLDPASLPDVADNSEQTHNTQAANAVKANPPPIQLEPTGGPAGGSSGGPM